MAFPELDHIYAITDRAGQPVAEVRIEDGGARTMVRWAGESDWVEDRDALGMVLFPDDVGVVCK